MKQSHTIRGSAITGAIVLLIFLVAGVAGFIMLDDSMQFSTQYVDMLAKTANNLEKEVGGNQATIEDLVKAAKAKNLTVSQSFIDQASKQITYDKSDKTWKPNKTNDTR